LNPGRKSSLVRVIEMTNIMKKGIRKLWIAVLERAALDLQSENELTKNDALIWFNNKSNSQINSFIGICIVFRLNPFEVREYILENHDKENFKLRGIYEHRKNSDH